MPANQKIISLFEVVRDIPYGDIGSRNPMKVLEKRKGTCSGKHLLLGNLYQAMGIRVKYMMCLTKFNFIEKAMPDDLKNILQKNEIYDYHNYLRIFVGKWINVDATFDMPLQKFGFTVNTGWNGKSNCRIAFKPIEVCEVADLIAEKKEAVGSLSKEKQRVRKTFIKQMSIWMDSIRNN